MKTHNSVLDEIDRIVEWYRDLPDHINSDRKSINNLLKARRKLASNQIALSRMVADAKEERDAAVFCRKKAFSENVLEYRNEGDTVGESEHKANIDTSTHRQREKLAEREYEAVKLIYSSVNDILNALSGDIRLLQYEYEKTNYRNE